MDVFGRHLGEMPIVLLGESVDEAILFNRRLREAMTAFGLGDRAIGRFMPHVSLAYEDRIKAYALPESVRWPAGRSVLLRSRDRVAGMRKSRRGTEGVRADSGCTRADEPPCAPTDFCFDGGSNARTEAGRPHENQ